MVATPKPSLPAAEHPVAALMIQKTLLWTDENRILDVAHANSSPQYMIVLEPESVVLFKFQNGRAQQGTIVGRDALASVAARFAWPANSAKGSPVRCVFARSFLPKLDECTYRSALLRER